jgi:drug/metabolite transporter (DMT)-like permease
MMGNFTFSSRKCRTAAIGKVTASRGRILAAFAAVYLIWGSTYLAIRFALEDFPPFLLMGFRSLLAGLILYVWGRRSTGERPAPVHWIGAAVMGALLFLVGHGGLAWGEQVVPSGVAALVIATLPIWMTLLQAVRDGGGLNRRILLGLLAGFAGVAMLADPRDLLGGAPIDPVGFVVLLVAALSWSVGSVFGRGLKHPDSSALAAGMNLLAGGVLLVAVGLLRDERFDPAAVSLVPLLSLLYLVVFGSVIGFGSFIWLLRVTTPSRVSTYGFVNPIVAVLLGWLAGGEALSPRVMAASILMVAGVAGVVVRVPQRREPEQ